MLRWFEQNGKNSDVVVSSRVRLARNLSGYNFSLKLDNDEARKMIDETVSRIKNVSIIKDYTCYDFKNLNLYSRVAMKERHVISNFLLNQEVAAGMASPDENISIMLNEEDHIRIQSFVAGMDIKKAYEIADKIDDELGEALEFAYDEKYGYLTTCPSNVGTGMRVSYMLHLPALAGNDKIAGIATEIGRFGMVLRGVYSSNDNTAIGDIYQISNQVTLGYSESEIIDNLNNITNQIINQERNLRKRLITNKKVTVMDNVFRSYGVLKYSRKLSLRDGLFLLSELRLGLAEGLIKFDTNEDCSIYQLMIGIQPANLILQSERSMSDDELDIQRSGFVRDNLPKLKN